MATSVFDLFKIGIGPSSSHTVGPMKAAQQFLRHLTPLSAVQRVEVELFGSLGLTGKGHGTDTAVLLGLEGEHPETVDVTQIPERLQDRRQRQQLHLAGQVWLPFVSQRDLHFHKRKSLPLHENGMICRAVTASGDVLVEKTYYSTGGGFVAEPENGTLVAQEDPVQLPYPFHSAAELLAHCAEQQCRISDLVLANEQQWHPEAFIRERLQHIWQVMQDCVAAGCTQEGLLPGGLKVPRRAPGLHQRLREEKGPTSGMLWVNLFALAVNEENAAGGRVVTAPTNGAAGILPAVMHYLLHFTPHQTPEAFFRFLLTAAGIGTLYKENASISGAAVGCQGEVGVACSMAAGALTEVLGGTPEQVENAAEIGMEHNLGLTCDPIGGLVQIPCIERNAIAANKAINAAQLALMSNGHHRVSLDKVIRTMLQTGKDMHRKYKETSRGGLAVNVVEC